MFVFNLGSNFEVIVYILLFGIFSEEPLNKWLRFETSLVVQWLRLHTPNVGDKGSTPGWGTKIPHATAKSFHASTPGEGNGYPPQYSCLENSREAMGL